MLVLCNTSQYISITHAHTWYYRTYNKTHLILPQTQTNTNRVMVHCPYDARPGQKIRFQLPIQLSKNELKTYSIHYNKEGWVRCVGTDLRFHWARHDGGPGTVATASNGPSAPLPDTANGVVASSGGGGLHRKSSDGSYIQGHRVEHLGSTFNVEGSAFVRKLSLLEGSKPPAHTLELVRAEEASLDAAVFDANITFQHLSKVSGQPFQAKLQWFKSQCDVLRVPWDVEHQVKPMNTYIYILIRVAVQLHEQVYCCLPYSVKLTVQNVVVYL
jgi:hypothetical protein